MKEIYKKNSTFYDRNGGRRPGVFVSNINVHLKDNVTDEDSNNREKVLMEIKERCSLGEELNIVVSEIAERKEIKQQFKYFIKNGIIDLASIFKNWYEAAERNKEKNRKFNGGIR